MSGTPEAKRFWGTVLLTVVLASLGFAAFHLGWLGFGYTFFILVPLAIGFILGQRPAFKVSLIFGSLVGVISFFYLLVTAQLEGFFCVLVLSPLILALMFVGIWAGYAIRKKFVKNERDQIQISAYPLLLLVLSGGIEHYFSERYDRGTVESAIVLPYATDVVYDYIKSVDTLNAEQPLLMQLGLSVPYKCVLEKEAIGARRVCYFEEGTIDEVVTDIRRGELLKMKVTRYGLPGARWIAFDDAIYTFEAVDNGTLMKRITTYQTELKPRFYWRFWEEKAIEAEHTYVLTDLEKRLRVAHRH